MAEWPPAPNDARTPTSERRAAMPPTESKRDAPRRRASGAGALDQVRALSHPLRLRLMELFATRPRTTMQAAEALGQPPTRLYHHVAALEGAGLVRVRETRAKRGTTEKYYETMPAVLHHDDLKGALESPAGRRDISALGVLVFDQARNELIQALARGLGEPPRTVFAVRGVAHLSRAEAKRMAGRLLGVLKRERARRKRARAAGARRSNERYALTVAMVPLTPAK